MKSATPATKPEFLKTDTFEGSGRAPIIINYLITM
jgi:hypothetical protein